MRLFGIAGDGITESDRAEWQTPPFDVALVVPDTPGLEFSALDMRTHFGAEDKKSHFAAKDKKTHFAAEDQG